MRHLSEALGGLAAAAFLLTAAPASAIITQANSLAELTQGPYTLEDFEDASIVSGVSFAASSGTTSVTAAAFSGSVTPSGTFGLSTGSFPDPISILFAAPTSSVGFFFGNDDTCCASVFDANLDIFDAGGLIGTVSVTANMNDFADQFIGFTSDELVTNVVIRYGSGSDVDLFTYIDDVRFNVAGPVSVPEPTTLMLVSAGLLGIGWASRRRKVIASR